MSNDTDSFDGDEESTDERPGLARANDGGPEVADEYEIGGSDRSLTEYLQWALFGILVLLLLVATFRFYFAASSAVDRLVTREYRSLFQAAFNLVILLLAGLGLSVLVRRMR